MFTLILHTHVLFQIMIGLAEIAKGLLSIVDVVLDVANGVLSFASSLTSLVATVTRGACIIYIYIYTVLKIYINRY